MRELDCDFCGAAAAGAYEVGPAPPDRSPTDRRRLVLCDDCRETLSTAVAPLLERLRAAESGADGSPTTDERADESAADGSQTTDERAAESGADGSSATGARAAEAAADGSPTTDGLEPTGATTSEPAPNGAATGGSDTTTDTGRDSAGGDPDKGTATADTAPESADDGPGADTDEEPPQFRKVMRLLNNRSFPVDRGEFVELAAGAYDLEPDAVEESLAYAVERSVLAAEDGRLVRG